MLRDLKETVHTVNPSSTQLRYFGAVFALFLIFFAYRFDFVLLRYITVFSLAAVAVFPRFFLPIHFLLVVITFPIGWMLSRIFLILFFFAIITPIAIIRRLLNYNNLKPTFGKQTATTYWEDFEENTNPHTMGL